MADLVNFKAFDLAGADLTVWVFKKSQNDGQPVFTGRWVDITEDLASALRQAASNAREVITETIHSHVRLFKR